MIRHYRKIPSCDDWAIFALEDLVTVEYYDYNHCEITLNNGKIIIADLTVEDFWDKVIRNGQDL